MKNGNSVIRFCRLAGSRQPLVENAQDLQKAVQLDPAHWAVIGMPLDTVSFDPDFLKMMDLDQNNRIRPDEFRREVLWLLSMFSDWSGIDAYAEELDLTKLNMTNPDAVKVKASAKLILENLGLSQNNTITLEQVLNRENLVVNSCGNGDGIITAEHNMDAELAGYIRDAIASVGPVKDITGLDGIGRVQADQFNALLVSMKSWAEQGRNPEMTPWGAETESFCKHFLAVRDRLTAYFEICSSMKFSSPERVELSAKADPMNTGAMENFYAAAPCAAPNADCILDLNGWINPRSGSDLAPFVRCAHKNGMTASPDRLTLAEWNTLSGKMAPRTAWLQARPDLPSVLPPPERITDYLEHGVYDRALALIRADESVQTEIRAYAQLRKLIVYQRYVLDFANDYLNLSRFFDPEKKSLLQPGYVLMDGRHFGLTAKVTDMALHKKIMTDSNICVMYLDLSTGIGAGLRRMTLAAAITSGTMRNIFIGRTGIFIGSDGVEWDAKVIDIIQHPVSVSEALQMPFYRFGEFMGKQADKFFSAKSKDMETKAGADLASGKLPVASVAPVEKTAAKQTPAISGSMMLMGGGVGLAALGSAFAFIANSLKSIPVWDIVLIFVTIAVVISAPMMLVSFTKLMNRSVSSFLAASNWAVNPKMRLSRKMGVLFTHAPQITEKTVTVHGDPITKFVAAYMPARKFTLLLFLLIVLAVVAAAMIGLKIYLKF